MSLRRIPIRLILFSWLRIGLLTLLICIVSGAHALFLGLGTGLAMELGMNFRVLRAKVLSI